MFSLIPWNRARRTAGGKRRFQASRVRPIVERLEAREVLTTISEFPIPTSNSGPDGITSGPDGNVWFCEYNANQIGRISPGGTITGEFGIPTANSQPLHITTGQDGNLWFTEFHGNAIGKMTPQGVVTDTVSVHTNNSWVSDIISGPDGNLWFTELNAPNVGRITLSGDIAEFGLPGSVGSSWITVGSDGNLWCTRQDTRAIDRITPSGAYTEFTPATTGSHNRGIATGPDGNLWVAENESNLIARISTTGTLVGEYTIPTPNSDPVGITRGPDGMVWFVEERGNKLASIDMSGNIVEYPVPTANCDPATIALGPDGNLWFREFAADKIGRIDLFQDTLVNTTTAGQQGWGPGTAIKAASNVSGSSIAFWKGNFNSVEDGTFYAQRYDPAGNPVGGEMAVTSNYARYASIAMDAAGDFVVTWDHGSGGTRGYDVFAQRFDSNGVAQGDPFIINTTLDNDQQQPTVGIDATGNFAISWSSFGQDGSDQGVYARRFDAQGNPLGDEFHVSQTTQDRQSNRALVMNGQGNFVVVWTNGSSGNFDVVARLYNAAGAPQTDEFVVNSHLSGAQLAWFTNPAAMDSNGNFVITWDSAGEDGSGLGVYARRYHSSGQPASGEFRVNTTTSNDQAIPSVGMDAAGNFLISWQSQGQDGDGWGIYGQRFKSTGAKIGGEFRVNRTTAGDQQGPSVALDAAGDAMVIWQGNGPGDDQWIFARQLELPRMTINDASSTEGDSGTHAMAFAVTLSEASLWPTTVHWATSNGSAKAPSDFTAASGNLTFAPGETQKLVSVQVKGDTLYETDENFNVTLSQATNCVLADAQATGTILNDDPAPSLSISDVAVIEGNSGTVNAVFTVSLSAASGLKTTVHFSTADGTATAPGDYASRSGTLTFLAGQTSKTITIVVNGDTLVEPDETFSVNLSAATNATIADGTGVGTILNDDGAHFAMPSAKALATRPALGSLAGMRSDGDRGQSRSHVWLPNLGTRAADAASKDVLFAALAHVHRKASADGDWLAMMG